MLFLFTQTARSIRPVLTINLRKGNEKETTRLSLNFRPKESQQKENVSLCHMMKTATVKYLGELRTECTHVQSGTVIQTDAPVDNNGKGEKFSPTDLVATAYASCMFTIIGIFCNEHGYFFEHGNAEITKVMAASPRRIGKLIISMDLSGNNWDELTSEKVIRAAKACPVAKSVSEDMEIEMTFNV